MINPICIIYWHRSKRANTKVIINFCPCINHQSTYVSEITHVWYYWSRNDAVVQSINTCKLSFILAYQLPVHTPNLGYLPSCGVDMYSVTAFYLSRPTSRVFSPHNRISTSTLVKIFCKRCCLCDSTPGSCLLSALE